MLILIADDELSIAELVAAVVLDLGCTPVVVADGRQALDVLRTRHPAVVVTDLMMPHLTGAELIAIARADSAAGLLQPTPIILMTAAGRQAVSDSKADAVLLKPFDLNDLESLLRRFLDISVAQPHFR